MLLSMGFAVGAGGNASSQLGDGTNKSRPFFGGTRIETPVPLIAVAAGSLHSLGLGVDGSVWAWGANDKGQLGLGLGPDSGSPATAPVQVTKPGPGTPYETLDAVVGISAGSRHNLAVDAFGRVWAWGANGKGQLGDGTTTLRGKPVIPIGAGMIAVAAGDRHSLALAADSSVMAWGHNDRGQLGDGTMTDRHAPVPVKGPGGSGLLNGIIAIATRGSHSLALRVDGTVWAWGDNATGALGDNSVSTRKTPVQVVGPGGKGFISAVIGLAAGTGFSLALRADGVAWAWGKNSKGQLGDGTTVTRKAPVRVQGIGGSGDLVRVTAIAAGAAHSMAILGGDLYAWGWNNGGRLGDGTTVDRKAPVKCGDSGNRVFAIGGGQVHSLVVLDHAAVLAWGANDRGQLLGAPQPSLLAVQLAFSPTGVPDALAGGNSHSLEISQGGHVSAWGANDNGQLGNGTTKKVTATASPAFDTPFAAFRAISAGWDHSLALDTDGTVWAWGAGSYGQLGDGASVDRHAPVRVKGLGGDGFLDRVVAVAAGILHSLALRADGTVWAWGNNSSGELGDGTTTTRPTPVKIIGKVKAIAAGHEFSLALRVDGTVLAWGANDNGQLGDNTTTYRSVPKLVQRSGGSGTLSAIRTIAAGSAHALAVTAGGTVWSWGRNPQGQLGDGSSLDRLTPVKVLRDESLETPLSGVTMVAAAVSHSLAVSVSEFSGNVFAWGGNDEGQLGDGTKQSRGKAAPVRRDIGGSIHDAVAVAAGRAHSLAIGFLPLK